MPAFTYTARALNGDLRTATIDAPSRDEVVAQLRRQRLNVVKVDEMSAKKKPKGGIKMRDIIGHAMANDSPYFKDLQGWRNDHTDWLRPDVKKFRHRLHRMIRRGN